MNTTKNQEIEIAYLNSRGQWKRKTVKDQTALEKWFDKNHEKYQRVEVRPVY